MVDQIKALKLERVLSKKEDLPKELRTTAIVIDPFLTFVLFAVYREDYSLTMFFGTMPIAFFLALAWLEIIRRIK